MIKGFKDFLWRGNVVDLAVAVVVGAAFTAVVTAFTSAFLKPLIQLVTGGGQVGGTFVVNGVVFDYAGFLNSVITFVLTAAAIYVLVVYPLSVVAQRRRRGAGSGPPDRTDVELLTEIRDLLAAGAPATGRSTGRHGGGDGPEGTAGTGGRIPAQDR